MRERTQSYRDMVLSYYAFRPTLVPTNSLTSDELSGIDYYLTDVDGVWNPAPKKLPCL